MKIKVKKKKDFKLVSVNNDKAIVNAEKSNSKLKTVLDEVWEERKTQIKNVLRSYMSSDKKASKDFKWVMSLIASLEPKQIDVSGSINFNVIPAIRKEKSERFKEYMEKYGQIIDVTAK